MPPRSSAEYRFGDVLALARRSWVLQMASALEDRGYDGYRLTDAALVRTLLRGPTSIGPLGDVLGVTRQAARKAVRGLEQRGLVSTATDPHDSRRCNVVLTASGEAYGRAIVEVIAELNRRLASDVGPGPLAAADLVLRAVIRDDRLRHQADRIPPPKRDDAP